MERKEIFASVKEIAVEVLAVEADEVKEESSFKDDLNADSLDLVEFVMSLEEKFEVSIPEEEVEGVDTIGKAIDLVESKLKG
jgi:acyl carrier protein